MSNIERLYYEPKHKYLFDWFCSKRQSIVEQKLDVPLVPFSSRLWRLNCREESIPTLHTPLHMLHYHRYLAGEGHSCSLWCIDLVRNSRRHPQRRAHWSADRNRFYVDGSPELATAKATRIAGARLASSPLFGSDCCLIWSESRVLCSWMMSICFVPIRRLEMYSFSLIDHKR